MNYHIEIILKVLNESLNGNDINNSEWISEWNNISKLEWIIYNNINYVTNMNQYSKLILDKKNESLLEKTLSTQNELYRWIRAGDNISSLNWINMLNDIKESNWIKQSKQYYTSTMNQ